MIVLKLVDNFGLSMMFLIVILMMKMRKML